MSTKTKAELFIGMDPSISGVPEGVVTMAVVIVFDDGSIYCDFPVGSQDDGENALKYALNLHGVYISGEAPATLDTVGHPDHQIEA